jgi:uncharacterized protein (DUF2252 family)
MSKRNLLKRIERYNRGREQERLAIKYALMRGSPFAFFRGSAQLFYEDWPKQSPLDDAPKVWLCGDLHLENFGGYVGADGREHFDICDFDDCALAPVAWDLARLCTSPLLAADAIGISPKQAVLLLRRCVDAYGEALASRTVPKVDIDTRQPDLKRFLAALSAGRYGEMRKARTRGKGAARRLRLLPGKTLPATTRQRQRLRRWWKRKPPHQLAPRFGKLIDVARRVTGTGSLGVARYVLLVETEDGDRLLDLKEAVPSALTACGLARKGRWTSEAARVAAVQRRAQALPAPLIEAVVLDRRHFLLRELLPGDDKLTFRDTKSDRERFARIVPWLGRVAAACHLRVAGWKGGAGARVLSAFGRRKAWRAQVTAYAATYAKQVQKDWRVFRKATGPKP